MKSKSFLIIAVTVLIILGIVFVLIRPTATTLIASYKEMASSREELKKAEERNKIIADLEKNKDEITRVAGIAEKYIPIESDSGDLILELAAIATGNNLKVEKTSIDTPKASSSSSGTDETAQNKSPSPKPSVSNSSATPESLKTIDFTMSVSGLYSDFLNFLKTIEASSRLIILKNIAIQVDQDPTKPISFQLVGNAFYKPKITIPDISDNIKVTKETINKFLNLKTNAVPINLPSESGFGRTDPFAGY